MTDDQFDRMASRATTLMMAMLPVLGIGLWAASTYRQATWPLLILLAALAIVVAFTALGTRAAFAHRTTTPAGPADPTPAAGPADPDQAPGAPAWEDLYRTLTDIYDEDRTPAQ